MIYLVWVLLGILAFIKKDNRCVTLLVALFIMCVFCFNTANPDLESYIAQYEGGSWSFTEPVYVISSFLFRKAGCSFQVFRFFWVSICLLLVISTIYRYSPYPTFVLFLYSVYPMVIDVVQFRFFIGYTIVLFAVRFLVDYQKEKKLKCVLLYFLFLFVATCCHYSCILYGVLGLLFLDLDKHKIFYFIILPIGIILSFLSAKYLLLKLAPIIGIYKSGAILNRMHYASGFGALRILVTRPIPIIFVILLNYITRSSTFRSLYGKHVNGVGFFNKINVEQIELKQKLGKFYDLTVNKCLFTCIYFILFFLVLEIIANGDYERLSRLSLLLSMILISRLIYYLAAMNKMIGNILFLVMLVTYFVSVIFFGQASNGTLYIDSVFRAVMNNNSLFF